VKGDTETHPFGIKAPFNDASQKTFHETSFVDLNSPEINQLLESTNFKNEDEPVAEHASRLVLPQNQTDGFKIGIGKIFYPAGSAASKPASPFAQSLDQAEKGTETLSAPMAVQRSATVRHTNPLKKPGAR
jgi:hypothetical protein